MPPHSFEAPTLLQLVMNFSVSIIAVILRKKPLGESRYVHILIDGNHRAVRAHREGREFKAIVLTPQETWEIASGLSDIQNPNTKKG